MEKQSVRIHDQNRLDDAGTEKENLYDVQGAEVRRSNGLVSVILLGKHCSNYVAGSIWRF